MFEKINKAYNQVFQENKLTIGIFFPLESYSESVPTMLNQIELAKRTEELGFAALWFRDVPLHVPSFGDVGQIYDPFVYLGYIAAHTNKIALATGSIILNLRHPIHTAKSAASVDILTKGRLILGVASGDRPSEYPAFNVDFESKKEKFQENLAFIKKLNDSFPYINSSLGGLAGDGDLLPKSFARKLPILITGRSSGQSLEWIANNSDGWISYPRNIEFQKQLIEQWRNALDQANSNQKPFAQSLYIDLVADRDAMPHPIHLGYSLGRNYLLEILFQLQKIGVNHIIINLKYSKRDAKEIIEELGEFVVPHFKTDVDQNRILYDQSSKTVP